jgi:hypothetical protein
MAEELEAYSTVQLVPSTANVKNLANGVFIKPKVLDKHTGLIDAQNIAEPG